MLTFISISVCRVWLAGIYRFSLRLKTRIDNERVANLIVMVFEKNVGPLLRHSYLYSFVLSTILIMFYQQLLTTEGVKTSITEELFILFLRYL